VNQTNRLHIDLENVLAPAEIAAIARRARLRLLPRASRRWLHALTEPMPSLTWRPQRYVRHVIDDQLTLYASAGRAAAKYLLIGHCGKADRLMLPIALVLQALPSRRWDVLRITRPHGAPYLAAGRDVQDMDDLVHRIRQAVDLGGYRGVTVLGMSAGGAVAAIVGLRLAADRAVLFGAALPQTWQPILADLCRARKPPVGITPNAVPVFVHCHGADHAADSRNALVMQATFGGTIHSFAGIAHHNVLYPLLLQRWLDPNFEQLLMPTIDPKRSDGVCSTVVLGAAP
jgi:hypothetical protein